MKLSTSIVLLLFSLSTLAAQNLVPNPGFESCNEIPTFWTGTFSKFNRWIKHWNSPTQGSPDILFTKIKDHIKPARPGFDLRPHFPRSGKIMLGIKTYGCDRMALHCKEYIQVCLKEKLIPGDTYLVEFYVNTLQYSILANNIGVGLSTQKIRKMFNEGLYEIQPVLNEEKLIATKPGEWKKISGSFVADSSYHYLLIGNFFKDDNTLTNKDQARIEYSFLFLDDVLLKNSSRAQIPLLDQALEKGDTIELSNINFEFNKASLIPSSYKRLDELVQILQQNPDIQIEIAGHTDDKGDADFNLKLSKQRAASVYQYLLEEGIRAERLKYIGYGEGQPITANQTETERQRNRRVEIIVLEN